MSIDGKQLLPPKFGGAKANEQLVDLASLAMEPGQQRRFIGIHEHRRCSDRLNETLLAKLVFDQQDVRMPDDPVRIPLRFNTGAE